MPSLILIVLAITILTPSQPVFAHTPYFYSDTYCVYFAFSTQSVPG